jgi:N-dimethylarginine dimethylaminohydrolase
MANEKAWGGQSMVKPLKSVLLNPPASAGWGLSARTGEWKGLGYLHKPMSARADEEHLRLRGALESAGCEVGILGNSEGLTLDAVYVHDASFMTDFGAICLRMGKPARAAESAAHRVFYEANSIPVLATMEKSCSAEAGDIVWLDARTLLIGRGYRTNAGGIEWLRGILSPHGITVIPAPLPHGAGPQACLHLMSLMSLLDKSTVLVDSPLLAVETVELLRSRKLRFVEIEPSERATLAANVLSLGNNRLLTMEENPLTNARLHDAGFEVMTFPGAEIGINGGGGPTCLTRPLLRA